MFTKEDRCVCLLAPDLKCFSISRDINPSEILTQLSIRPSWIFVLVVVWPWQLVLVNGIITQPLWINYILVLNFQEMVFCLYYFIFYSFIVTKDIFLWLRVLFWSQSLGLCSFLGTSATNQVYTARWFP